MDRFIKSLLTAAAFAAFAVSGALAQDFPEKPVEFIVPWPAGGGTDLVARLVATGAEKHLGAPIVMINRPGAGGAQGTTELAEAAPDGYTIAIDGPGFISRQFTLADHPAASDLQPIVWIGGDPLAIAVQADAPWSTLEEFLEAARSQPLLVSGLQPGSSFYTSTLIFENAFDVQFQKIPYPGFAQMGPALLAGEIQAGVGLVTDWAPFLQDGAVRILAVMADERHYMAEDVPTVEEATGTPFAQSVWRTIFVPAGTPPERVKILEDAFIAGMSDEVVLERARASGWIIDPAGAEETARRWQEMEDETYPILEELGLIVTPRN